jgi:hypothetical protein
VQYTEVKPGGSHARQDQGGLRSLDAVRALLDSCRVYGRDPIVVTEFSASGSTGRTVPASKWDAADV